MDLAMKQLFSELQIEDVFHQGNSELAWKPVIE
jgi:hypothetical protein